jgi:uncharacterized protein
VTLLKPENVRIDLPLQAIADVCRRFDVEQLQIFGSALSERFSPQSDVDFLVTFQNDDAGDWACKYSEMAEQLSAILGRKVEVVSQRAVEQSENHLRRKRILGEARTIYVA